jgi:hypothetical protein
LVIVTPYTCQYHEQGYWQRAIASEAKTAVRAYLMGGIAWLAVPLTFSSIMGLAAVALANREFKHILNEIMII